MLRMWGRELLPELLAVEGYEAVLILPENRKIPSAFLPGNSSWKLLRENPPPPLRGWRWMRRDWTQWEKSQICPNQKVNYILQCKTTIHHSETPLTKNFFRCYYFLKFKQIVVKTIFWIQIRPKFRIRIPIQIQYIWIHNPEKYPEYSGIYVYNLAA